MTRPLSLLWAVYCLKERLSVKKRQYNKIQEEKERDFPRRRKEI